MAERMVNIKQCLRKVPLLAQLKRGLEALCTFGQFLYVQRIKGFTIPTTPHFDSPETTRWFLERLQRAKFYVEFGSGGSTYAAAQDHIPFISVDSDRFFLKDVQKKIQTDGFYQPHHQTYKYADIGLTEGWGVPVLWGAPSANRQALFRQYSDFPVAADGPLPDLVLVDGRFRVACALKAFRALQAQSGWTLVVDDYVDRPEYAVLEDFGHLETHIGRMAIFTGVRPEALPQLEDAIQQAEMDYR